MKNIRKPLSQCTAGDLMSTDLVLLRETQTVREAAHALLRNQISGAPVVDAEGRCVGVLSAADFVRLVEKQEEARASPAMQPMTCGFQEKHATAEGREETLCTLPPGTCAVQLQGTGPGGERIVVCSEPHTVLTDWQIVQVEKLPTELVSQYRTREAVTVSPEVDIRTLARLMLDAHIHRVVVVDADRKPIGVVTTTDLLAALAFAESG